MDNKAYVDLQDLFYEMLKLSKLWGGKWPFEFITSRFSKLKLSNNVSTFKEHFKYDP